MRPNNFDLIRLLAALQVAYCHTIWHLHITTGIGNPTLAWFVDWFPGVPIFFTISGFLISRSWERTESWQDYARKRILRIYPALWVQLAVGVLLALSFGVITPNVATSGTFIAWIIAQSTCMQFFNPAFMRSFGIGVLNGSLWTIPVELGFYLTLPVLYQGVINRVSRRSADVCVMILSLASFVYWYYLSTGADPESFTTKLAMVSPLPHLYMFLFGILLQRNFERVLPYIENRGLVWLSIFAVCMLVLNPWGNGKLGSSPVFVAVGRLMLAMTILSFAFSWKSLSERFLRGNDISYGVYLYHALVINTLVHMGYTRNGWYLGVVALVSVILAALSWRLIEYPAIGMRAIRVQRETLPPTEAISHSIPPKKRAA